MTAHQAQNELTPNLFERTIESSVVRIIHGNLVDQNAEAIVNAANPRLAGGGGVDGAIHRAGGPSILRECRAYIREHGPLPTGEAMWTHGGALRARYVIHTVGPVYRTDAESAPLLACAYRRSLEIALTLHVRSIAFPSISTGAYGYPIDQASSIAVSTVVSFLMELDQAWDVRWVCLHGRSWQVFRDAIAAV